jgi:hypothetical protein
MAAQQTHYHRGSGWALCGEMVVEEHQQTPLTCPQCLGLLRAVVLQQAAGCGASAEALHQFVVHDRLRQAARAFQALAQQAAAAGLALRALAAQLHAETAGDTPDTPLEEWCAGVDQLLQDLDRKESAEE